MKNTELSSFLYNLSKSIEKDELNQKQLSDISSFFLKWNQYEEFENKIEEYDKKDMIKFMFLGWYIYNINKIRDLGQEEY